MFMTILAALAYPIVITAGLIVSSVVYIVIIKIWIGDV